MHYYVNVVIPFIDHLLVETNLRFSDNNRAGVEILPWFHLQL